MARPIGPRPSAIGLQELELTPQEAAEVTRIIAQRSPTTFSAKLPAPEWGTPTAPYVAATTAPSPITPAMEASADADIAAGRVTRHDDMESLFAALDAASAPPEQPEPTP